MAEKDLKKWTTFFHEAGVPRGPANDQANHGNLLVYLSLLCKYGHLDELEKTKDNSSDDSTLYKCGKQMDDPTRYATLFCNHRIKDDLLGDLTKEILNDIGIIVMGDVMSILKHARAVYAKLEREKTSNQFVQDSELVDVLTKDDPLVQTTSLVKKKKIVAKLPNKPKTDVQQTETVTSTIRKKLAAAQPKIAVTVDDSPIVPKKRLAKTTMTLSERFASETVPLTKVSRVSMNGGDQAKTVKKVLTQAKPSTERLASSNKGVASAPVKRKSAFERLGKEETSTLSKDMERLSPKIKITKLTKSPVTSPPSKVISLTKNESSVFKRLGETDQSSNVASTTRTGALTIRAVRGMGSRIVSDDSPEKPSKSHSALRPLKPIRAVQPVKPVSSVKARISADTTKESSRKSVFSRLGS